MCGIGAIFKTSTTGELPDIRPMLDIVRHRGPDDEGYAAVYDDNVCFAGGPDTPEETVAADTVYRPRPEYRDARFADALAVLGHRRLSIIDLSPTGHQPMSSEDQRYICVYNGEIYNFRELRQELEEAGAEFVSASDTEVLLAAYRTWGVDCLQRFNGMFAFVIVDRVRGELFAARDRFGIKPLYYWHSPAGVLAFASEIKQFTVLPGWRATLDGQAAYDQLNWGMVNHTDATLFSGVRQLYGGEYCNCSLDQLGPRLPIRQWYHLAPASFHGDLPAAAEQFAELLNDAVALRLRADVPVGTSLSGGLDSSSIVCLANRLLRSSGESFVQKTFSACAHDPRFDERQYVDTVVEHCRVEAHYTYPDLDELLGAVDSVIWHHDEPFESTSVYAEWEVFRLAAENNVKVTLDGHGADELLLGYDVCIAPYFAGLFARLRWLQLLKELHTVRQVHGLGYMFAAKGMANMLLPEAFRQFLKRHVGQVSTAPAWLSVDLLHATDRDPGVQHGLKTTSTNTFSKAQLLRTMMPMQLKWADRNSMAHSVECRVPFLDHRIVEFAMGLPTEMKMHRSGRKRILREAMAEVLPPKISRRQDKMGFVTPEEAWVRGQASDWFRKAAGEAIEQTHGLINPKFVNVANEMIDGRHTFSFQLWRIICFSRWMERYGVNLP